MAVWSCWVFTTVVIWFAVFLTCFMPIKKESVKFSSADRVQQQIEDLVPVAPRLRRQYNKTVLILIDALRADFVMSPDTPMSKTKDLINKNVAFVAKAHTPTVTLPRVKALVTGSVPGFVDVVLNFGSTKYEGDSILAQMSQASRRVVFYGDDTWIKLFSDHFTRFEGTTSFFVTDYTEVDNNVTRHLPSELSSGDFDLMILHYLGLDHIGHMAGPSSPLVPPKLREMDDIISMVYQSLTKLQGEGLPNLLIVCGDHGMSDQGSHGGASYSETRVPLVFLSTNGIPSTDDTKPEVDQIDLVPTLSEMLGLPIPQNSLGRLLLDVFEERRPEEQLASLLRNTIQLLNLLNDNLQDTDAELTALFKMTCRHHAGWVSLSSKEKKTASYQQIKAQYNDIINMATSRITKKLTTYDMPALITCVMCLWMAVVLLAMSRQRPTSYLVVIHVTSTLYLVYHLCRSQSEGQSLTPVYFISVTALTVVVAMTVYRNRQTITDLSLWIRTLLCQGDRGSPCVGLMIAGTLLHTLSLLSSSYVEEEHQTWYFLSTSVHILHFISQLSTSESLLHSENTHCHLTSSTSETYSCIGSHRQLIQFRRMMLETFVLLLAARTSRSLNQTGNKWLHLPDIGDWLTLEDNKTLLSILVAGALLAILVIGSQQLSWLQTGIIASDMFCVFWFRASTGTLHLPGIPQNDNGILPARLSFLCIMILLVSQSLPTNSSRTSAGWKDISLTAWTLLHLTLMRAHNIILVALMTVQQSILHHGKLVLSPSAAAMYYLWMGRTSFFLQGNSNSIATVDVGAGYVGQQDYDAVPVAFLLSLATYAGPIYWFLAFLAKLNSFKPSKRDLDDVYYTVVLTCGFPVVVYSGFVVLERYHLFVWTVFLPKLLYFGMDLVIYSSLSLALLFMYYLQK